MTYSESAQGMLISAKRVVKELKDHGITSAEEIERCFKEVPEYEPGAWDAGEILKWLGY